MKQYKVFKHANGTTEAVKLGWSWPAFFFTFIWAMVKNMWGLGVGLLVFLPILFGIIIIFSGGGTAAETLINCVAIIINIIFGVNGNSLREKNLVSRGYKHADTVTAANPEGAFALYLKEANERH